MGSILASGRPKNMNNLNYLRTQPKILPVGKAKCQKKNCGVKIEKNKIDFQEN
jgi:hypothetical protein